MRHLSHRRGFSRRQGPREALIKGLVMSLVEHGRIRTTLAKAKELRGHVEKAITIGKKGDLHTRRILMARFPNEDVVKMIVDDLSKRFNTRPGGYTRILKTQNRPGDNAPMAYIEFVDYKLPEKTGDETVKGDKSAKGKGKKTVTKKEKTKKTGRKSQAKARKKK